VAVPLIVGAAVGRARNLGSGHGEAMPNLHYIPMNLTHFKLDNSRVIFFPTDEPQGQIQCTVGCGVCRKAQSARIHRQGGRRWLE
jgi:hypothetical protein